MRLGKILAGVATGVGAVVLAPVVLPVAGVAAAGAGAMAGAAATAATAVAGAAGAAATAAAGAAGAVASSAIGTAAIGTMGAIGSAVGTAAATVGIEAVATVVSTEAGAAAVGAIATSAAVGASTGVSGVSKLKRASDIKSSAERKYDYAREEFDKKEKETNEKLEKLGEVKLKTWDALLKFVNVYNRIKNIDFENCLELDEKVKLDKDELENIRILSLTIKDVVKGGMASFAGGELIGLATSTGLTSVATASTGTAISTLAGAAKTKASLAALGGGAISEGGLGMAGGAIVSNCLTFAPAAAIAGIFINNKGKKNLEVAQDVMAEADKLSEQFERAGEKLEKLSALSEKMRCSLVDYYMIFTRDLMWLEQKVSEEEDFLKYKKDEQRKIYVLTKLAIIVKDLACTQLMDSETKDICENDVNVMIEKKKEEYKKDCNICRAQNVRSNLGDMKKSPTSCFGVPL